MLYTHAAYPTCHTDNYYQHYYTSSTAPTLLHQHTAEQTMCWSASVSLNTYLLGVFASALALYNRVITLRSFLFVHSFITIQLVEFFIWSSLSSAAWNKVLSMAGFVVVLLQPLASLININDARARRYLVAAYLACVVILLTIVRPLTSINFRSEPAANGHLAWYWLDMSPMIVLTWMAFFLVRYLVNREYFMFFVVLFPACVSWALYHKTLTWGSLWCWFANCMSIYLLVKVFAKDLCTAKSVA